MWQIQRWDLLSRKKEACCSGIKSHGHNDVLLNLVEFIVFCICFKLSSLKLMYKHFVEKGRVSRGMVYNGSMAVRYGADESRYTQAVSHCTQCRSTERPPAHNKDCTSPIDLACPAPAKP